MFTKKLKKAVKETKKATEDVKKVVKKAKKVEAKKVEDKKPEVQKVVDHTQDLKDVIETASKLKGVRGFIVLVDAQTKDEKDKTHGTGLKAICGSGDILANLIDLFMLSLKLRCGYHIRKASKKSLIGFIVFSSRRALCFNLVSLR